MNVTNKLGKKMNVYPLFKNREILAFVHIEKAAGTTLIHILRKNYFMRYMDVKPLTYPSKGVFCSKDLKKIIMINPGLMCISGHSIKPYSDLSQVIPKIRYITLLRNPVKRYISQYLYWVEKLGKKYSFKEFLQNCKTHNFQTKKIAGSYNLQTAKDILRKRFFLVGIVEKFDEFLILLKNKIKPFNFNIAYRVYNVRNRNFPYHIDMQSKMLEYRDDIIEANLLDIELYKYVKDELLQREIELLNLNYYYTLKGSIYLKNKNNRLFLTYIDYIIRKLYYEPILGAIRILSGMNAKGSY